MNDILALTAKGFNDGVRYVVNEGGTRSGKTYSVLSLLYHIAASRRVLISVVSETFPHLRKGAIRDFQNILESNGLWNPEQWGKVESTYTFPNGSLIEFFSVDAPGKVHGPARDILFINEAQNISYEIARHLFVRTTSTVFIDFNPTHEFWAHTELLNDTDTLWIHSTYLDNGFLTPEQVKEIEKNKKNENWWRVYGLGLVGQLDGLVFPEWKMVDSIPEGVQMVTGLDFGYTNDPAAVINVGIKGEDLYLDEVVYQTGLSNAQLSKIMAVEGVAGTIYADSAEPKSIDDLYLAGWNIHPATKGKDSVMWGLDLMKQFNIHITKRSVNLHKEFRNYAYAKDKNGKALNQPIDVWNHAIDAARYAVSMVQRKKLEYTQIPNTKTRRL